MKIAQIILLQLFLSLNSLFAYSTDPVWLYTEHSVDGYSSYVANFTADTLINGLPYKELNNHIVTIPGLFTNPWITADYQVYLRFDSVAEIVYIKQGSQPEQVLYDYSMQPGDTLNHYAVLSTIDTVQLLDLSYRERFIFRGSNNDSVVWIKWIGNIAHPLNPYYVFGSDFLLCYHEQSNLLYEYQNLVPVQCSNYTYLNDSPIEPEMTISLNPFSDRLEVRSLKQIREIHLFNQFGQLSAFKFSGEINAILDLSTYPSGMFFINIIFDDGSTYNGKAQKLSVK